MFRLGKSSSFRRNKSSYRILDWKSWIEQGKFLGHEFVLQGDTRLGSFGRTSTRCEKPFETRCPADVYKCIARTSVLVRVQQAFHKVVWESGSSSCLSSLVSPHVRVLQNSWQINVRAFTTTSLSLHGVVRINVLVPRNAELFGEIHSWIRETDSFPRGFLSFENFVRVEEEIFGGSMTVMRKEMLIRFIG